MGSVDTSTSKPLAFRRCRGKGGSFRPPSPARRGISSMAISGRAEAKADAGPRFRARESMRPRTRIAGQVAHVREIRLAAFCIFGHCVHDLLKARWFCQSHPVSAHDCDAPFRRSLESTSRTSSPRSTVRWPLAVGLSSARVPTLARAGTGAGRSLCPASVSAGLGRLRELFFRRATCWQNGSGSIQHLRRPGHRRQIARHRPRHAYPSHPQKAAGCRPAPQGHCSPVSA